MRPTQLILDPPLPPHVCSRCLSGRGGRDWFIDLGIDTMFDGTVYICNICLIDIVDVSPDFIKVSALEEALELHRETYRMDKELVEAAANQRELLEDLGIDISRLESWRQDGRIDEDVDSNEFTVTIEDSGDSGETDDSSREDDDKLFAGLFPTLPSLNL